MKRIIELSAKGNVRRTTHWKQRARQRSFDYQDFLAVLESGWIEEEGVWSPEHKQWKFCVVGLDADGREFKAVVAYSRNEIVLISGMRKEKGRWARE